MSRKKERSSISERGRVNVADLITIALSKGRLADQTFDLLEGMGVNCAEARDPGRKLVLWDHAQNIRFILVKPSDVPTYVDHGVADLGVVGKDTLMEAGCPLYEVLDLGFGRCRLCIAGFPGGQAQTVTHATFRVATKYPGIARSWYEARGQAIEIIELHGSVELGPVIGLSDVILDIVESGSTLRANGLEILEEVCEISARLVCNRVSLKTKRERIRYMIDGMESQLNARLEQH